LTDLTPLADILGHRFSNPDLLEEALTHASALNQGPAVKSAESYQRLEFLGDRVLGLVVADLLVRRFPDEPEGALAKRFAVLVQRETLAEVAESLELAKFLRLATSEDLSGGRDNPTTLADCCEAVIGALFMDGGYEVAAATIRELWLPLAEQARHPPRDPKTALQEWAQARGLPLPRYREVRRSGPAHAPDFTIEVSVPGAAPAEGQGRSKRQAEREAAASLLERLEEESETP